MGIVDEFVKALKPTNKERPKAYSAEVSKIDDEGVVWVYLAGSEAETPTALSSSEVKAGDSVNVEWRNNKLYIAGNTSNPSAGTIRVTAVEQASQIANDAAVRAVRDAGIAQESAETAQEAAQSAQDSLKSVVTGAQTVEKAVSVMQTALEAVVDYDPTTDTTKEYFWHDANGAHVLGTSGDYRNDINSNGMKIVDTATENAVAEFGTDGAQIGQDADTHAVIDYHSLQLIAKEGRTFFHVSDLRNQEGIATLTDYFYGDDTTTQFTFLINQVVAVIEVSIDDVTQEEGVDYTFTSSSITFTTAPSDEASIVVTYESTSTTAKAFTFGIRRSGSAVGAYSFVHGYQCRAIGAYSHAEGSYATANGQYSHAEGSESRARGRASHAEGSGQANEYLSHAEGLNSKANGQYSHSEGYYAQANGNGSHACGEYSIADGAYQTVIGRNNVADTTSAFIIGNGTTYNARRNAFQIGFDGSIKVGLITTTSSGDDYALYQAITALGWQNDVIE